MSRLQLLGRLVLLIGFASSFVVASDRASSQTVISQYYSLGCEFGGEANVTYSISLAKSSTFRQSSCADYAAVGYDYYWNGGWYGTYFDWCYTSWQNQCIKQNSLGATQVYTYHQIYTQGLWRQWEYGYASG